MKIIREKKPYVSTGISKKIPSNTYIDKTTKFWNDINTEFLANNPPPVIVEKSKYEVNREITRLYRNIDPKLPLLTMTNLQELAGKLKKSIKITFEELPSMKLTKEERTIALEKHRKSQKELREAQKTIVKLKNATYEQQTAFNFTNDTKARKERQKAEQTKHDSIIAAIIANMHESCKINPCVTTKPDATGIYKTVIKPGFKLKATPKIQELNAIKVSKLKQNAGAMLTRKDKTTYYSKAAA